MRVLRPPRGDAVRVHGSFHAPSSRMRIKGFRQDACASVPPRGRRACAWKFPHAVTDAHKRVSAGARCVHDEISPEHRPPRGDAVRARRRALHDPIVLTIVAGSGERKGGTTSQRASAYALMPQGPAHAGGNTQATVTIESESEGDSRRFISATATSSSSTSTSATATATACMRWRELFASARSTRGTR